MSDRYRGEKETREIIADRLRRQGFPKSDAEKHADQSVGRVSDTYEKRGK